jgi:carboxysome peptide B
MQISRVVSDLVTTRRVSSLSNRSLRVVEDHRGNFDVVVDPIGAKPGDYVITIGYSAARAAAGNPNITTDLTIGGIIDHWDEARWRG